jgi:GMP synthase-like glutamine amidotransferase
VRIIVLRHVDCEPPAAYLPALVARGPVTTVRLGVDDLPDPQDVDVVVAMGGPMGVYDVEAYPWLRDEVAFIAAVVERGGAVWGVCLGAQLLAAALGAKVYPGPAPEVGVAEVMLTEDAATDAVFAGLPAAFPALHWHGDTFDLPCGAVRLASSEQYENQAFRYGASYGLQFHLEASAELAAQWLEVEEYRASLRAALGESGEAILLGALRDRGPEIAEAAATVIRHWTALVGPRDGES